MFVRIVFFLVAVNVLGYVGAQDSLCSGVGEEYTTCGSACPKTCNKPPQACTLQCVEGCFCREGLVRDQSGRCIRPEDCPQKNNNKCLKNEVWNDCGLRCQASCVTPFPVCDKRCHAGCYCREGYIRQDNSEYAPCIASWECYNGYN